MMSRLEEIRERYMKWEYDFNLDQDDLDWLLEQAEQNEYNKQALTNQERSSDREIERLRKRVQELEEENRFQMSETHKNLDKVIYLDKEKERYKQALEDIEDALYSGWQEPNDKALDIIYKMQKGESE